MRITYIHQHFCRPDEPGGTRSYEFARRLASDGHRVTMICAGLLDKRYTTAGFEVIQVRARYENAMSKRRRILSFLIFMAKATWITRRVQADVVLATSTPLTVVVPGLVAARIQRARFILEIRDLWPSVPIALGALTSPITIYLARFLERLAYRRAETVIALSPGMAEGVREVSPTATVSVIPNGSDISLFRRTDTERQCIRQKLGWRPDETILVYAGSFGRSYGLSWPVKLAAELADPSIRIVLIGSGTTLNDDQKLASSLNISRHALIYTGALSKMEVANYVAAADIALSCLTPEPSLRSLSLNKVFDALAAGRPVLFNHDGWLSDLLTRNAAGWAVDPSDVAAAARRIRALHADRSQVAAAAAQSSHLGDTNFARDTLYNQFAAVLSSRASPLPISHDPTARTESVTPQAA